MLFHLVSAVRALEDALRSAGLKDRIVLQLSADDAQRLRAIADKYAATDAAAGDVVSAITVAGVAFALDNGDRD